MDRVERALVDENVRHFACVGGVARNKRLREKLARLGRQLDVRVHLAPMEYCTDNAAMVAALAGTGCRGSVVDGAHCDVCPNLPLGAHAASS